MKKLTFLVAILLLMANVKIVDAATNISIANGGAITADSAFGQSVSIVGVMILCGASACSGSVADTATLGGMTSANTVWEGGAAANTSAYFDYHLAPIVTTTGSTVNLDNNATAMVVYIAGVNP